MTDNLALELTAGMASVGSRNDGSTFEWVPSSCSSNGDCAMNGNTKLYNGYGYYTWYAATAGVGTYNNADTNVDGSICPAGWRLTAYYKVDSTHSYSAITNAYFGFTEGLNNVNYTSQMQGFPLNFFMNGYISSGGINLYGSRAEYLSSTPQSNIYAWRLYYRTFDIYATGYFEKYAGSGVRCVAL